MLCALAGKYSSLLLFIAAWGIGQHKTNDTYVSLQNHILFYLMLDTWWLKNLGLCDYISWVWFYQKEICQWLTQWKNICRCLYCLSPYFSIHYLIGRVNYNYGVHCTLPISYLSFLHWPLSQILEVYLSGD